MTPSGFDPVLCEPPAPIESDPACRVIGAPGAFPPTTPGYGGSVAKRLAAALAAQIRIVRWARPASRTDIR